jgi:hypothetical protein
LIGISSGRYTLAGRGNRRIAAEINLNLAICVRYVAITFCTLLRSDRKTFSSYFCQRSGERGRVSCVLGMTSIGKDSATINCKRAKAKQAHRGKRNHN